MTYFVTGATGFVGRHLVSQLLRRKGPIHVLVRKDSRRKLEAIGAKHSKIKVRAKPRETSFAPGTVLLREWGERVHRVAVTAEGLFDYEGRSFKSLTAVARQMNELPYYNLFFGTTTPPAALLSEKVTAHTNGKLNKVFFTGSGSEATDTWFRMARVYWAAKGMPTKKQVIARRNGYHGSTVAGASLGLQALTRIW